MCFQRSDFKTWNSILSILYFPGYHEYRIYCHQKITITLRYTGLVVVQAKRQDINGQCTKKDGKCKGTEVRDSIYNDMKASMYLLANAFRINQTKAPDNLPSVKAAKKFFKEMDFVEKAAKKKRQNDKESVVHFAAALEALDTFLDLVELPPTDTGHYDQEFDRAVGSSARIT